MTKNYNSTIAVKMIPKDKINKYNTLLRHSCVSCNRWISIHVKRCVWCEAKRLKRVYGIE